MTSMLRNTAVSTTAVASLAVTLIANDVVGIIGAEKCSVSAAIASITQTQNMMQLSYDSGEERLLDIRRFPLFGTVSATLVVSL